MSRGTDLLKRELNVTPSVLFILQSAFIHVVEMWYKSTLALLRPDKTAPFPSFLSRFGL